MQTYIDQQLVAMVADPQNHRSTRLFSSPRLEDGWEVWFQCQAFAWMPTSQNYVFQRGKAYNPNGAGVKSDFRFKNAQQEITLWFELKVQLQGGINDLISRFASDINKIQGVNLPRDQNSICAIAIAGQGAGGFFTQASLDYFKSRMAAYNLPIGPDRIGFRAVLPGSTVKGSWSEVGRWGQVHPDSVVILLYLLY